MSHRADFFDFAMRINENRHICGLGPMHLYGRGCKTFNLLIQFNPNLGFS